MERLPTFMSVKEYRERINGIISGRAPATRNGPAFGEQVWKILTYLAKRKGKEAYVSFGEISRLCKGKHFEESLNHLYVFGWVRFPKDSHMQITSAGKKAARLGREWARKSLIGNR